jgi:hypothetical protein
MRQSTPKSTKNKHTRKWQPHKCNAVWAAPAIKRRSLQTHFQSGDAGFFMLREGRSQDFSLALLFRQMATAMKLAVLARGDALYLAKLTNEILCVIVSNPFGDF